MKKIKNLIFIFETFLTQYDFERYNFSFYLSKKINLKIFNVSPITRKKYFHGEKFKKKYIKQFQSNFFSLNEFANEIAKYNGSNTVAIIHVDDYEYDYKIRNILKKYNLSIAKHIFGGQPFIKKNIMEIFFFSFIDFYGTFKKLVENFFFLILKFQKIKIPEVIFYVGSKLKPNTSSILISLPSFEYDKVNINPLSKLRIKKPFALYIDVPVNHTDQYDIEKRFPKELSYNYDEYYETLTKFFKTFENKFNLKILVTSHPRANYNLNPYKGFKLFKNKTYDLVAHSNCKLVLLHSSLAINYPILLKKPVIFLIHQKMTYSNKKNVKDLSNFLEKQPLDLDKLNFDEINFKNQMSVNNLQYEKYVRLYIAEKKFKKKSYEIIYNFLNRINAYSR
jgi:hypothetical protein